MNCILYVVTTISQKVLFLVRFYKMQSKLETILYYSININFIRFDLTVAIKFVKIVIFPWLNCHTRYRMLNFALSEVCKTNDCNCPLENYNFVQPALERYMILRSAGVSFVGVSGKLTMAILFENWLISGKKILI